MHAGEVAALVIVCLLLLFGCVFFTFRCCSSIVEIHKDANQPRKSFARNLGSTIRRSFRRMSGRSRSRARGQTQGQGPVVHVRTVDDLVRERSELHPHYTKHPEPPPTYDEAMSHPVTNQQSDTASTTKPRYVHPQYNTDYGKAQYNWGTPYPAPEDPQVTAPPVHKQFPPQSRYSPVQEQQTYHRLQAQYSPHQPTAFADDPRTQYSPRQPVTPQYSSPHQHSVPYSDPRTYHQEAPVAEPRLQYSPRNQYDDDDDPSALYAVPHKLRKQQQQSQRTPTETDYRGYDHSAPNEWSHHPRQDTYKSYEQSVQPSGYDSDDGGFGARKRMPRSPGYQEGLSIVASQEAPSTNERAGLNYGSAYSNQAYTDEMYAEPARRHIDPDYANHREFYKRPSDTPRQLDHEDGYCYQEKPYLHGNDPVSGYGHRSPSGYRSEREAPGYDHRSPTTYSYDRDATGHDNRSPTRFRNDRETIGPPSGHRIEREAADTGGYPRMHYRPDTDRVHLDVKSYGLQGDTYI